MNKIMSKYHILLVLLVPITFSSNAQTPNVTGASNTATSLQVSSGCFNAGSSVTSVNVDMVEIDASTAAASAYFGGSGDYLWVAGFTGVSNSCTGGYASGITVRDNNSSIQGWMQIPWQASSIASQTVDYMDVAIGMYTDATSGDPFYFALVVYETQGEIYLEHYNINIDWGTPSVTIEPDYTTIFVFPPGTPTKQYHTNNPVQLSNANGTAERPHIEIFHTHNITPAAASNTESVAYAVTWHQMNSVSGLYEVWAIDGEISASSQNEPPPPNNGAMAFKVDDGMYPDVVAVTAVTSLSGHDSKAFVTYTNNDGDELHLSHWDYNSTTVEITTDGFPLSGPLETNTNMNSLYYPRISGPMYYDFDAGPANDPACVIAVTDNDGTVPVVNVHGYYDAVGSPYVTSTMDATNNNLDFSHNGYTAIMPVITGVGDITQGLYNVAGEVAYADYPTVFYSDYDYNANSKYVDLFAFGTDRSMSINLSGGDYYEVNPNTGNGIASPLDLSSLPIFGAATTNNAGHDLLVAYWDGDDRIFLNFTGGATNYAFKPGKPNSLTEIKTDKMAVYPNPVNSTLNITNANGANYMVIDIAGRALSSGTLSGKAATVNVASLAPGMYFLHLDKDGHQEKLKFVKQ